MYIHLNAYTTLLPYYYDGSVTVCIYLFKCLLPYYLIIMVVWLCVYLFKCLLPYYLITTSGMAVCTVYLFKCLLPYNLITVSGSNGCVYISLNAYYLITLLLLYCSCVYICLNAYYLITLLLW